MRLNRVNSAIDRTERNKLNENFDIIERGQSSVQNQINQLVIEGDSSVEAAQARVSLDDTVYDTLKARLDAENEQVTQQLVQNTNYLNELAYSVLDYGAVGDGVTDDTTAINTLIQSVSDSGGGKIYVPLRTYLINSNGVQMKSNVVLEFANGAEFALATTGEALTKYSFEVIKCFDIKNFKIINATIKGNRAVHTGSKGAGHGIGLYSCENFELINCISKDNVGDGYFVGYIGSVVNTPCRNGKIIDCVADNNMRNGLSPVSFENLRVIRGQYKNSNGQSPEAGIDIEPWDENSEIAKAVNLILDDVKTYGNNGYGFIISTRSVSDVSIQMVDCNDEASVGGLIFHYENTAPQTGLIIVDDFKTKNNRYHGIEFTDYGANGAKVILNRPQIDDFNNNNLTTKFAGILINRTSSFSTTIGNIDIINPSIQTKNNAQCIQFVSSANNTVEKTRIIDATRLNNPSTPDSKILSARRNNDLRITDALNLLSLKIPDADYNTSNGEIVAREYDTSLFTAQRLITLDTNLGYGDEVAIRVVNSAGARVTSIGGERILPLANVSGKTLIGTYGSSIRLRKVLDSSTGLMAWLIINQTGTWTVEGA